MTKDAAREKGEQNRKPLMSTRGFNEQPSSRRRRALALACGILREPMTLLLVAILTTYLLMGDPEQVALLMGSIFHPSNHE